MSYDKVFKLRLTSAQLERLKELGSKSSASDYLRSCINEDVSPGSHRVVIDIDYRGIETCTKKISSLGSIGVSEEDLFRMSYLWGKIMK